MSLHFTEVVATLSLLRWSYAFVGKKRGNELLGKWQMPIFVTQQHLEVLTTVRKPGQRCALKVFQLVGYVSETEVDALDVGMPAYARLISGRQIQGEISFVARSADERTRTFRVEITAENVNRDIRDGLTAEIFIPRESGTAHLVPQAALTLNDSGELGVRTAEEDGRAGFQTAEILREELDGIWLRGLPAEVNVIFVGHEYVAEGRELDITWADWRKSE